MKQSLRHSYLSVRKDGIVSFGGDQSWDHRPHMRQSACGVIAAADLLLYLLRNEYFDSWKLFANGEKQGEPLSWEFYADFFEWIHRKYLPVIPHLGMIGWELVWGLNRFFRHNDIPLKASWGFRRKDFFRTMSRMLEADIPVIFSIGPNFPLRFAGHKLPLYQKRGKQYRKVTAVNAHFVTAVSLDDQWIEISSWGKRYYVNRKEYWEYAKKRSGFLLSNLVKIEKREPFRRLHKRICI